jgi:hypothetical protein
VTEPGGPTAAEGVRAPSGSAQADLERLGELLQSAARGEAEPAEVKRSVETYWQVHEPALRVAVSALSEHVRLQAVAELNRVQGQLAAQRKVRESISATDPTTHGPATLQAGTVPQPEGPPGHLGAHLESALD